MDVYKIKSFSDEERQTLLVGESVKTEEQAYMKALTEVKRFDAYGFSKVVVS